MGSFSSTPSIFWTSEEITFLKSHWRISDKKLAGILNRSRAGINGKRNALGLPQKEWELVPLTAIQKQVIYGSLLGDGSISKGISDKNYRFSESHSIKQKEYLLFKYEYLKPYSGKFIQYNTKWGGEVKFSTCNHPEFTNIRSLFYSENGKKRITSITLEKINQPIALAMWIGDDGSHEKDSIRIATASYNKEELAFLIDWLESIFNVTAYFHKHGKYWYLSIREDRFILSELIKPLLPQCMHYKLFNSAI